MKPEEISFSQLLLSNPKAIEELSSSPQSYSQSETDCSINSLTNDCLSAIFAFLPLRDQLRCGQTCHRWQLLVPIATGQTHLNVKALICAGYSRSFGIAKSHQVKSALKSVLPTYGAKLKSISLCYCEMSTDIFHLIVMYCPQLQQLECGFGQDFVPKFNLLRFSAQLGQLTELRVLTLNGISRQEKHLIGAPGFHSNLSQMITSGKLPLEELVLSCSDELTICSPRLTMLNLRGGGWTSNGLAQICKSCPNLVSLKLCDISVTDFSPIGGLTQLVELEIGTNLPNGLKTSHLAAICCCSSLVRLKLSIDNVKELRDFTPLSSLKLEEFTISSDCFDDSGLDAVVNVSLRKLILMCRNVSDFGLERLADRAINLEELGLFRWQTFANSGLNSILQKCRHLREFELFTYSMKPEVMLEFGQCENLRKLKLSSASPDEKAIWLLIESRREQNNSTPLQVIYPPSKDTKLVTSAKLRDAMEANNVSMLLKWTRE